nr:non-canonical non-ribosomal peptide synthetase fub8 [Quercus suber]
MRGVEIDGVTRSSSAFRRPAFRLFPPDPQESIRSLPHLVRFNALHNPEHIFLLQTTAQGAVLNVTFAHFAHVVQRCSEWLRARLSPMPTAGFSPAPVAILLESDVRSFAYLLSLLWLGIPCLLISIRLTPAAIGHLLREVGVETVLVSQRTADLANAAADPAPTTLNIETLEEVHAPTPPNVDVATAPDVDECDRNVIILHSSGTTGLPKPIRLSHRYLLGYAGCHAFADDDDCSGVNVSTLPLYHGFGLLAPCLALSVGMPCCLPASSTVPTGRSTLALCRQVTASSLMTVPSILEDMVADMDASACHDEDFATLTSLDFVAVGGGSMSEALGVKLHGRGVRLLNHYGATEIGALAPIFFPDQTYDWRYLRLRKDIGLDLRVTENIEGDQLGAHRCRLVGYPFGWNTEFEIQDELECNPDQPASEVRILGRMDDLIVLATGEKVRPQPLEQAILQCPNVKTAVVFGSGQFELGALIEPVLASNGTASPTELVEIVWRYVLEGNRSMDGHAQITSRDALIVTSAPIPRTDKGSVARKEVESKFAADIASVYERLQSPQQNGDSIFLDQSQIQQHIRQLVHECLPEHKRNRQWDDDTDIFELGIDSLQCIRLQRALEASSNRWQETSSTRKSLQRNFPYQFNTVASMTAAIQSPGDHITPVLRQDLMRLQLQRFTRSAIDHLPRPAATGNRVLMTGSTGSVGAHVLEQLCHDTRVERIICLVRQGSSEGNDGDVLNKVSVPPLQVRQQEANARYRISLSDEDWSQIEFLEWTPGAEVLGFNQEILTYLAKSITCILHCAWPMDFNRSVTSFEPHVHAMRSLAELAVLAQEHQPNVQPKLVVTSSIAAVGLYSRIAGNCKVPEMILDDPLVTLPMGYAEAKWVCEHVCAHFARMYGGKIDPIVVRLGQITGSTRTGYWNPKEHLPIMFQAAQQIGQMPLLDGDVSWLPIDEAASILIDILLTPRNISSDSPVLHVENPIRLPWADVVVEMNRHLGLGLGDCLPFPKWLDLAAQKGALGDHLDDFLKQYFTHMATGFVLDTTQARKPWDELRTHALCNLYSGPPPWYCRARGQASSKHTIRAYGGVRCIMSSITGAVVVYAALKTVGGPLLAFQYKYCAIKSGSS